MLKMLLFAYRLPARVIALACMLFAFVFAFARSSGGYACVVAAFALAFAILTGTASAQTDIPSTVTALGGIWTTISALAIVVVLFVLGRKLLRKL
jgi:hypothetical protein